MWYILRSNLEEKPVEKIQKKNIEISTKNCSQDNTKDKRGEKEERMIPDANIFLVTPVSGRNHELAKEKWYLFTGKQTEENELNLHDLNHSP